MRGLMTVAWRGLTRRKVRSALTAIAVTLGVANVCGVFIVNSSIERGVALRAEYFGNVDVVVNPARQNDADTAYLTDLKPELERRPGVRAVGAIWGAFKIPVSKDTDHWIAALDATSFREYIGPRRMLRGRNPRGDRDEIVVARTTASTFRLSVGDAVKASTTRLGQGDISSVRSRGELRLVKGAPRSIRFRVSGISEDPPFASGEPSTSYTSLATAWRLYEPDATNQLDFYLEDGTDVQLWTADLVRDYPELRVDTSATRPELQRFLTTVQAMLAATSALSVFVGAFLIYLTFSIAIVERTRLYGSLHALGARGRQVAAALLIEAGLVGVVSTVLGVGIGYALSIGLVGLVGGVLPVPIAAPTLTVGALVASVVVGLAVTLIGAAVPAVRAARMSPITAIRGPAASALRASRAWMAGAAIFAAAIASALAGGAASSSGAIVTATGVLIGAVLLVPLVLGPLAATMRRLTGRVVPGLGDVAVMHVARERSRSSYTLALVMVVLAAIFTVQATSNSLLNILDGWVERRFGADLLIYGPKLTPDLRSEIAGVDGISESTSLDFGRRLTVERPVRSEENLVLIDPESFFDIAGFPWAFGSDEDARAGMRRGGHVFVTSEIAHRQGIGLGDEMVLAIGGRSQAFRVAGVYATLGQGPETGIVGSLSDVEFFEPRKERDAMYVNFERDVSGPAVMASLRELLTPGEERVRQESFQIGEREGTTIGPYFAITGTEIKDRARAEFASFFRLFLVIVLIAAAVGVLGMANTLAASVLLRFREIGILQAVGAGPRDIRRMVVAEAAVLSAVAFVLALGLGAVMSWIFTRAASAQIGFSLDLVLPVRSVPVLLGLAALITVLASVVPARRAERLTPVEALRYE